MWGAARAWIWFSREESQNGAHARPRTSSTIFMQVFQLLNYKNRKISKNSIFIQFHKKSKFFLNNVDALFWIQIKNRSSYERKTLESYFEQTGAENWVGKIKITKKKL